MRLPRLSLLAMTLQEALLQSVSSRPGKPEVIRVFPALSEGWDAEFRLLARGGFLVTAAIRAGEISPVEIESRLGEECRIRSPWPGQCRITTEQGTPLTPAVSDDGMLSFPPEPAGRYRIASGGPVAGHSP